MSQENLKVVRRALETNRSGPPGETVEKAVTLVHPDWEFVSRLTAVEGGSYRGIDGVRAFFEDMADAWQEWHIELFEIAEIAPDTVLTDSVFRATGKGGVDVELRSGIVWTLFEGRIVRVQSYPSREEALKAAGLSE